MHMCVWMYVCMQHCLRGVFLFPLLDTHAMLCMHLHTTCSTVSINVHTSVVKLIHWHTIALHAHVVSCCCMLSFALLCRQFALHNMPWAAEAGPCCFSCRLLFGRTNQTLWLGWWILDRLHSGNTRSLCAGYEPVCLVPDHHWRHHCLCLAGVHSSS